MQPGLWEGGCLRPHTLGTGPLGPCAQESPGRTYGKTWRQRHVARATDHASAYICEVTHMIKYVYTFISIQYDAWNVGMATTG